jgi:hypothetical protein
MRFLDATGQRAALVREGAENRLSLIFNNYAGSIGGDAQLLELVRSSFEGYALVFGITLPQAPLLLTVDERVLERSPPGTALVQGNRVSFSAPMADLLSAVEPARLEIVWTTDAR